jgi:hypothetical protein
MPYRVIDLLREPIPELPSRIDVNTRHTLSISKDDAWLSLPADHRSYVKRWKDFNYPVLRVALKDFLDQPVSSNFDSALKTWPDSVVRTEGQDESPAMDLPSLTTLGNELNLALIHGVHLLQDEDYDCLEPVLRLKDGHSERVKNSVSGRELTLQYNWTLHISDNGQEEEQPVVIGVNKMTEEFPLSSMGKFNESGRLDKKIEMALCQVGTACWYKDTPYAFIITPEGAVLLLFGRALQHIQNSGVTNSQPWLDVRYSIIPWEYNDDDVLHMPLLMALWALCMVAWCDCDRAAWDGSAARLNTWREVVEKGKKIHAHLLVPQDNKGHPPGANIIPGIKTPIATTQQALQIPRSYMFKIWHPDDLESPLDSMLSAGASSSTTVTSSSASFPSPIEQKEKVCGTGGGSCFKFRLPGLVKSQQAPTTPVVPPATSAEDLLPAPANTPEPIRHRTREAAATTEPLIPALAGTTKPTQQLAEEIVSTIDARIPATANSPKHLKYPAQLAIAIATTSTNMVDSRDQHLPRRQPVLDSQSYRVNNKRKRGETLDVEELPPIDDSSEPWVTRLRPRKRRPSYRE